MKVSTTLVALLLLLSLSVPYGDGAVDVRVDDRMYLVAPGVLINESVMKKLGVRVGSLLLVILQEDST
jgi:hypothetical protein